MFCKYCGKKVEDGSRYCVHCGKQLVAEGKEDGAEETAESEDIEEKISVEEDELNVQDAENKDSKMQKDNQTEQTLHSGRKKRTGVAVAAACLLLAAAGGAAMAVHRAEGLETVRFGKMAYDLQDVEQQEMPDDMEETRVINLYELTHQPSVRDLSKKWDSQLFYWLEDTDSESQDDYYLAKCKMFRTSLKRSDNNHIIDYEVYCDPEDGTIYKIVSIETLEDGTLELTDYYYKDGQPNFIFRRNDTVYTPTYASIDIPGERFYFEEDQMVKWRWIYEPQVVNQWILELEDTWYTQWAYPDISAEEQKQFDEKETEMLNAAYNTLEAIQDVTGKMLLEGTVVDLAGEPLEGVWVAVGDVESGKLLVKMQTGADGRYAWKPENTGTYFLVFKKEGYEDTIMLPVQNASGMNQKQEEVILCEKSGKKSQVTFSVYQMTEEDTDSQTAGEQELRSLEQAEISIHPGFYYTEGKPLETLSSEASGQAEVSLKPGEYTVEVKKKGFVTLVTKILVKDSTENVKLYCMEEAKEKTPVWTVVLTWDNAEKGAADLDATMFIPQKGTAGNMRYLNTRSREDGQGNRFLYDGKGTASCEVLELKQPENGSYKYYVNDYSYAVGKSGSVEGLSKSGALVQVYKDGVFMQEFSVPSKGTGDIWEVFEIQNGELIPIQKLYEGGAEEGWWIQDKGRRKWVEENGIWHYYSPTGLMETSKWIEEDGNWYYVDEYGAMIRNGWKEIEEKQYYFGEDGIMYVNRTTPDGCYVGEDGVWREFTERQQEIVKGILEYEINHNLNSKTRISVDVSDLDRDSLLGAIYDYVWDNYKVGKEAGVELKEVIDECEYDTYTHTYYNYIDRIKAERMIEDVYGKRVNLDNITTFDDGNWYIDKDKIYMAYHFFDFSNGAKAMFPEDVAAADNRKIIIEKYFFDDNLLTVQGQYGVYDSVGQYSAKFQENPDSFFGFTLVSYEAQEAPAFDDLAAAVTPYIDSGTWAYSESGVMDAPHDVTELIDMGTYYKLCNWEIEQETEGGADPQWTYQGDIYISKNARFEYRSGFNEYIRIKDLSFYEYVEYVQSQKEGLWMQILFSSDGSITEGGSRIWG